jgi:hypothetical protein
MAARSDRPSAARVALRRDRVCPAFGNFGVEPARRDAGVAACDRFEDRGRERHEFEALGEDDRRDAPTLRENGAAAREPDWTVLAGTNLADRRRTRYVTCREPRPCGEVTAWVSRSELLGLLEPRRDLPAECRGAGAEARHVGLGGVRQSRSPFRAAVSGLAVRVGNRRRRASCGERPCSAAVCMTQPRSCVAVLGRFPRGTGSRSWSPLTHRRRRRTAKRSSWS